ncbi:MAG: ABC transporter permease [Candidatus Hadarchaeales archaeon]
MRRDIEQMLTVAKYEIKKYVKGRRVLATVILIIPISLLAIYFVANTKLTQYDFIDDYFMILTLISAVIGILYGSDAISSEFAQKTGYVTLAMPVGRVWMGMGKFLAAAALASVSIVIPFAMGVVYMVAVYGSLPSGLLLSLGHLILYGLATMSAAFAISAAFSGEVLPVIISYFVFIIIMPYIEALILAWAIEPWFFLTFARKLVPYFSMSPPPPRRVFTTAGVTYSYPRPSVGVAVTIVYLVVGLAIAVYLFWRKEMK